MPNLLQLTDTVSRELDDLNANFFTKTLDIQPSIQDGYNLIVSLTECIESYATINFVNDLVFYDFSALIPDYLRIFGIFNNNTQRWMEPCTLIQLEQMRVDWELANDQPYWFLPIDYKTVAIFPTQLVATGNMTVMYKAKADTLTANSTPQIPQEQTKSLIFYSVDDLLDQAQEFQKAMQWATDFDNSIEAIKKVLRERSSPNHLYYKHGV